MRPIYFIFIFCLTSRISKLEFAQLVSLGLVDGGGEVGQRGSQLHKDVGG